MRKTCKNKNNQEVEIDKKDYFAANISTQLLTSTIILEISQRVYTTTTKLQTILVKPK